MARVLVVDDSVTLRNMVAHVLSKDGHEVLEAACAEDALARVADFVPDIVVTDMYMPGLDGIGLTQQLRSMPGHRTTPILVLSTDSSQEAKQRGRAGGVTGWISKPFDPATLQSVVQKVLH